MAKITGQSVTLYNQIQIGIDSFGNPIYEEEPIIVDNILIGEPSTDDITSSTDLYGRRIAYILGIPKGDNHDWNNKKISWIDAYGQLITVKSYGVPMTGIEANIPLDWHKKVRVEAYEQGQS